MGDLFELRGEPGPNNQVGPGSSHNRIMRIAALRVGKTPPHRYFAMNPTHFEYKFSIGRDVEDRIVFNTRCQIVGVGCFVGDLFELRGTRANR